MVKTRTIARPFLVLALFGLAAGTAAAIPPEPPAPPKSKPPTPPNRKQIVFPVLGTVDFSDDYGAPRPQGRHEGIDILAPRHAYALAAEAGRVRFYSGSDRAGCMLYLDGKSGTTYLYIHLNNDVTKKNDNRGACVPGMAYWKGLKDGATVAAGEPIGYVGNSGDADGTDPHLHFEVHPNDGGAANPFPYLRQAERLIFPTSHSTVTLTVTGTITQVVGEQVTIKVVDLQAFPAGTLIQTLKRPLKFLLAQTAQVDMGGGKVVGPSGAPDLVGKPVLVLTEPTFATLAAAAARPKAYRAARLVLTKRLATPKP
jgi:hypothetical protein